MAKYFDSLTQDEKNILEDTFLYITLLVSNADGSVSKEEVDEAINTIKVRGFEANHIFHLFYDDIYARFELKLQDLMSTDIAKDKSSISEQIAKVNAVLAKLPLQVSAKLYDDYVKFAHRIANASGGVLGFMKVSKEEKNIISLPMITPIHFSDEEE